MAKNGENKVEAYYEKRKRAEEDEYCTSKKQKYQEQELEMPQSNKKMESLFRRPVSFKEESKEPHFMLEEEVEMEDDDGESVGDNFHDDDDDDEEDDDSDYVNSDIDDYWSLL